MKKIAFLVLGLTITLGSTMYAVTEKSYTTADGKTVVATENNGIITITINGQPAFTGTVSPNGTISITQVNTNSPVQVVITKPQGNSPGLITSTKDGVTTVLGTVSPNGVISVSNAPGTLTMGQAMFGASPAAALATIANAVSSVSSSQGTSPTFTPYNK